VVRDKGEERGEEERENQRKERERRRGYLGKNRKPLIARLGGYQIETSCNIAHCVLN
jgi:hypothetical protein